jgi:hypothetical protein
MVHPLSKQAAMQWNAPIVVARNLLQAFLQTS